MARYCAAVILIHHCPLGLFIFFFKGSFFGMWLWGSISVY